MNNGLHLALAFSAAAGFGIESVALGSTEVAVINALGNPDPVHVFNLDDPGKASSVIGHTQGSFSRGMDFDSIHSFYYYVSTETGNDPGDRGLWYWDNGVNTQLFQTPKRFDDTSDGDMTLSGDGTKLYVTVDNNDKAPGHSLAVFENLDGDITFREIGETKLQSLVGLAMDPVTGDLYAYDDGTDALYTLDLNDGTPSLVGFSGLSLDAFGGMDFSPDGETLLLGLGNHGVFKVDKTTGSTTSLGPIDSGSQVFVNALSFRSAIPTPASLALLAVAGCMRRRRRRQTL